MEDKDFEEFYSLCDREVRRQRLLGADDISMAYLLTGMVAAHPDRDFAPEQEQRMWKLLVLEKEEQSKVPTVFTPAEFKEELQAARNALKDTGRYLNDEERTRAKCMNIIGWVTSPSNSKLYTPSQLREMFDLIYED